MATTKEVVKLKTITDEFKLDAKASRRKLRGAFENHEKNTPWEWTKDSREHKKALDVLKVA